MASTTSKALSSSKLEPLVPSASRPIPIFVIVPGASQTPSHYAYLIHLFHSRGYGTLTALLPSGGATEKVTVEEDAEFIRSRMLLPVLDTKRHNVVLVIHSYAAFLGVQRLEAWEKPTAPHKGRRHACWDRFSSHLSLLTEVMEGMSLRHLAANGPHSSMSMKLKDVSNATTLSCPCTQMSHLP